MRARLEREPVSDRGVDHAVAVHVADVDAGVHRKRRGHPHPPPERESGGAVVEGEPHRPLVIGSVERDVVRTGAVAVVVEVEALVALEGVARVDPHPVRRDDLRGQVRSPEVDLAEVAIGDQEVGGVDLVGHHGAEGELSHSLDDREDLFPGHQAALDERRQAVKDEGRDALGVEEDVGGHDAERADEVLHPAEVHVGGQQYAVVDQALVSDFVGVVDGRGEIGDGLNRRAVERERIRRIDGRLVQPAEHGADRGITRQRARVLQEIPQNTGEGLETGAEERGQHLEEPWPQRQRVRRNGLARCEGRAHAVRHESAGTLGAEGEAAGGHPQRAYVVGGGQRREWNLRRDDVQEEVGCGRGRKRPVVGEAEVLVVGRPDHERRAGRDGHVGKPVVIVQPDRRDEVDPVAQRRLRVQIGADFGDHVVVFVPPEDRPAGARIGPLQVDAVGEALPGADVEAVLDLGRHGARLVHDRRAGAEAEGSVLDRRVEIAPGIGHVEEGLREEPALRQAGLREVVRPVLHLKGPDARHVHTLGEGAGAAVHDERPVVGEPEVEAGVGGVSLRVVVPGADHAACAHAGLCLAGIVVFPVVPALVLAGDLQPEALRRGVGGPELAVEERALAARQRDRGALPVDRRGRDDVHHAVRRVGSVERRPGAQRDFDPVDVQVGRRKHLVCVEPERRNARVAVVDDRQQASGEDVVEAARHHGPLGDARLDRIHPGKRLDVLGHGNRRDPRDIRLGNRRNRRGSVERLFLAA